MKKRFMDFRGGGAGVPDSVQPLQFAGAELAQDFRLPLYEIGQLL